MRRLSSFILAGQNCTQQPHLVQRHTSSTLGIHVAFTASFQCCASLKLLQGLAETHSFGIEDAGLYYSETVTSFAIRASSALTLLWEVTYLQSIHLGGRSPIILASPATIHHAIHVDLHSPRTFGCIRSEEPMTSRVAANKVYNMCVSCAKHQAPRKQTVSLLPAVCP